MTAGGYADRYQSAQVLTASRGRLVVLVFDLLLATLRRARYAVEQKDEELRLSQLATAREAINELMAALDHSQGELAGRLHALYDFMLRSLLTVRGTDARADLAQLEAVARMATELREAFDAVADLPLPEPAAGVPA
ncbi:MAG: flagellar export chaperone FliS [Gemmatimonadaceae bacterium]